MHKCSYKHLTITDKWLELIRQFSKVIVLKKSILNIHDSCKSWSQSIQFENIDHS